jgi:penicillin-binding protein 1C
MKKIPLTIKCLFILTFLLIVFKFILFILPYPELDRYLKKPYSLEILDRDGKLLQVLTIDDGLRREYIPFDEIPGLVKEIFIKSEDKRFYYHPDIDPVSLCRSIFIN